ncbi:MAG: hypothetical protein ACLPWD_05570 [Methanobacterium sp.]
MRFQSVISIIGGLCVIFMGSIIVNGILQASTNTLQLSSKTLTSSEAGLMLFSVLILGGFLATYFAN